MSQLNFTIKLIIFSIIVPFCFQLGAISSFAATPQNFTSIAKKVTPGVVNIRTVKVMKGDRNRFNFFGRSPFEKNDPFNDFFNRPYGKKKNFTQRSLGSGFIIDEEGYIVTNHHVIENADEITVVLEDEKEFKAEIIGRDPYTDIALIKIKTDKKITHLTLGNSDILDVGQWVVAIGNPFGLSHTVTAGIVSAKGRIIGSGPYDDFIQTDASINPGNSGGPLLNMKGEVVGINTMIVAGGQGIGFAIPISMAKGIIEQLKSKGDVTRGWLGVTIQDLKPEIAQYYGIKEKKGALVISVIPGDPAAEAGIRPNDIIIAVNGKKIESGRDITTTIADIGVGEFAKITIIQKGKQKTVKVKIGKRPDSYAALEQTEKKQSDDLGIRLSEITPQIARQLNLDKGSGIIVAAVSPNSKAEKAGMLQGDVIVEINRKTIENVQDFKKEIKSIKKDETIAFLIKRVRTGLIVIQIKK